MTTIPLVRGTTPAGVEPTLCDQRARCAPHRLQSLNRSVGPRSYHAPAQQWGLRMLTALRSGSFVTRERMRVYCVLLLLAYVATIVALLATAHGIVDAAGRPIGTDFANVYAAGKLALAGRAGAGLRLAGAPRDAEAHLRPRGHRLLRLALSAGVPDRRGRAGGPAVSRRACSSTRLRHSSPT